MPPELIQWIPPAVIVAILLYIHRSLRQDMKELRQHVDTQIGNLRSELHSGLNEAIQERTDLRNQIGELRERMAHLEGLLEGLREAITRRNVA